MAKRTIEDSDDDNSSDKLYTQEPESGSNEEPSNTQKKKRMKISLEEYDKLDLEDRSFENTRNSDSEEPGNISIGEPGFSSSSISRSDAEVAHIVVRHIFARAFTDRVIKRQHLTEAWKGSKRNFEQILATTNTILKTTHGMSLELKQGSYVLLNCLSEKERDILDKLWEPTTNVHQENKKAPQDEGYFLASSYRSKLPGENSTIVKDGVIAIILSLVIIEGNHLNKLELIKQLHKFGLSNGSGKKNTTIDHDISSLIQELIKLQYIKSVFQGAQNVSERNVPDSHVYFKLGNRALAEYGLESFYGFIKHIYGSGFNSMVNDKILTTLKLAFADLVPEEELLSFEKSKENIQETQGDTQPDAPPEAPPEAGPDAEPNAEPNAEVAQS